ncbi:MAG: alpha-mannosidase [Chloroflexi bacterium]|nr:alpha-mannosidase [Chloroflexota bacterium]
MTASNWGYFAGGMVHIICSSHNDIAWFDTPAATIAWRDIKSITPALERMAANPAVHFSMENVLYLLEYLERHPDRKAEIHRLALEQRFDWGATYNQPYESLLTGEQLVRQVYFGRRLVKQLLPGVNPRVYYSPDVPGRARQMPQILAKAGIPYLLISRHKPSLQRWFSPDGSSVLSWSMGHYGTTLFRRELEGDFPTVRTTIQRILQAWSAEYERRCIPPHFAFIYSMDYIPPKDFDGLLADWEQMRQSDPVAPTLRYSTPEQFFDAVAAGSADFERLEGERPNTWVYIHGPTHHHAISAKREAGVLLPAAEMFHTIDALLSGSFAHYPAALLTQAWADSIYDDHGWGGNNGYITDEVFRRKLVAARDTGRTLLDGALRSLAARVRVESEATPVTVFNDLGWARTDVVTCRLPIGTGGVKVTRADGTAVPRQRLPAGNGLSADMVFVAEDVPAIGYATYYLVPDSGPTDTQPPVGVTVSENSYENAFYRATLAPGGIRSLLDKQLGQEILETYDRQVQHEEFLKERFLGAEVFVMESVGNDAHEFGYIQQPSTVAEFERASQHRPAWHITESGPVYTAYTFSQQLAHCLVVEKLVFFHSIKRIDCKVSLYNWDATRSREVRLALPLNLPPDAAITYEVPFGVVEVGRDEIERAGDDEPVYPGGPVYNVDCRTLHPREVQNFISASGPAFGVTLSSSVAACDYIDPTTLRPVRYPILQPLLLASRKSCHSKGNWYVQGGDHHYHFSILSHPPGWTNGSRYGVQANHPLRAVARQGMASSGELPPQHSFLSVSPESVMLSALKKAEDDDAIIVRCYEVEGHDTDAAIRLAFPITAAARTNIIEEDGQPVRLENGTLRVRLGHHAVETFKLTPGG